MRYHPCSVSGKSHTLYLVGRILQSVLKAVRGFKDLTDLLSREKRVTCSAIKPLIEIVNDKIKIPKRQRH